MLMGAHARGRRHSLQGQGNFILENVRAHHIASERSGGEVLLKMARELQKELQLSPGTAAVPRCQPRDSGGGGDAERPPQVAGLQLGRPGNAGCAR